MTYTNMVGVKTVLTSATGRTDEQSAEMTPSEQGRQAAEMFQQDELARRGLKPLPTTAAKPSEPLNSDDPAAAGRASAAAYTESRLGPVDRLNAATKPNPADGL